MVIEDDLDTGISTLGLVTVKQGAGREQAPH